jgi:hypothetical protein
MGPDHSDPKYAKYDPKYVPYLPALLVIMLKMDFI